MVSVVTFYDFIDLGPLFFLDVWLNVFQSYLFKEPALSFIDLFFLSLPLESQGRGSLVGCRLWGHTESDTTEVT